MLLLCSTHGGLFVSTLNCAYWGAQGEQKGLVATPRFALYVVRTKPLLLALLCEWIHSSFFLNFCFSLS
jgi:hypothetical protein